MGGVIMKREDKELLLKDLCARLPYKVQASFYGVEEECECWDEVEGIVNDYVEIGQYNLPIEAVKPYLFPLSSMTEEEKLEYTKTQWIYQADYCAPEYFDGIESYDWLNKHHFDYRELIEKGLAIDATGLNIY